VRSDAAAQCVPNRSAVHTFVRSSGASVGPLASMPDNAGQDGPVILSILAICVGASVGAVLRWLLASRLNSLLPSLPPGTLVANLLGGYLIGIAVAFFAHHPSLSPQWRLLLVTGFLGGLTTFSTFSAEVVINLMEARMNWALATAAAHLLGSIAMTLLGIGTVWLIRSAQS
jgi:CrcB protein